MSNKRIEWIDSTRGIAILLVVVGHVVGGYTGNYGMPQYQRIIDMIVDVIYTFHMPLFFMISGYVFGLKKYNWSMGNYVAYVNKKAKTLLIPYFLFSALQILIKLPLQGKIASVLSWKNILLLPIIPIDQFWFIYVLFFIFCLSGFMDWKVQHNSLIMAIILFIVGKSLLLFGDTINEWGTVLIRCLCYYIFFFIGYKLCRMKIRFTKKEWFILTIIFGVSLIGNSLIPLNYEVVQLIVQVVVATSGSLSVISFCEGFETVAKSKLLQVIGSESMSIYIVHVLLCAIIRVALIKIGFTDLFISIAIGIVLSIMVPILMSKCWKMLKQKYKVVDANRALDLD